MVMALLAQSREQDLRSTLKMTFARVVAAARRRPRQRPALRRFFPAAHPAPAASTPLHAATLVALAVDRLAPATLRASSWGRPVEITVPDAATAAVFRAALEITAAHRCTDRLLTITVAEAATPLR
jgi:hypothetical protein